jgi:Na+-transporting NADH:ubiquinone oxidoreductase subunit D
LGFGTIFGMTVLPENFIKWTIMVMPPSAFFMLAILIWVFKGIMEKREAK